MRKEVEKMKKFGLIGLMLLVVLVTPVMAATVFIEPNKTTVAPGGIFAVDISVQDGTANAVLLNFTFDTSKISYVSGSTQGLFNTMDTISSSANYVRYLGVSSSPVNIASKTKVATAVFQVDSGASGTISFNVVTASVDGVDATPSVGSLTISTTPPPTTPPTTPPPTTPPTVPTNKGPITIPDLAITSMKLSDEEVTYGQAIDLTVTWSYYKAEDYGTRYIAVIDWYTYTTKVKVGGVFNVAKATDPDNYKWLESLPEQGGSRTYSLNTANQGMYSSYYVVVAFNNLGTIWDDRLVFLVKPVAGKPAVSISATPMTAALGDRVELKYSLSASEDYFVGVLMTGWEGKVYYADCVNGTWSLTPKVYKASKFDEKYMNCPDYFELTSAYGFTKDTEGYIVAKIAAGKDPQNLFLGTDPYRAEATQVIILAKPTLSSISVPSKHVKGTDLTITGVTNVAETNSKYDIGLPNMVTITIKDLNDNTIGTTSAIIGADRTFSVKIDNFGTRWPDLTGATQLDTGYYKVEFKLTTDTGFEDDETTVFELVKGMVKISPDKTTVVRGDKVKFTIITNLKVNSPVYFIMEDNRIIGGSGQEVNETLKVDATGKAYKEIEVAQTAPLTEYKFKAKIAGDVIDTVSISVVKQTIDLNADKTTVARGGEIRFTGTTTANNVCVFASEENVFEGVPNVDDVTTDSIIPITACTKKFEPDSNDRLDFKIKVRLDADAGTYYLYFYAPTNASQIDKSSDPQKMFAIVVTDPRILSVEIPSVIPYQGEVEVKIVTDPGDRNYATVTWTLEGPNVRAKPTAFGKSEYTQPDANDQVEFRLDLKAYKGATKQLEPGLYVFTVKLYLGTDEVDKVQKLVEISSLKMDVKIEPETIVVGDQIKITVETSREGVPGYDHVWVTMVGPNYKSYQRVTLDSTGKGSVTFETLGIADGTYKFYIRDTMNTTAEKTEDYLAKELYYLDPADALARTYKAHDDLLVIKTVQILKEKPAVTTPPPTTPPVTTPEVTPTTPPPTPVETTPPPTTTPAPGPIPGFEAIFAIAGLIAVAYLLRKRQ
ncbi:MAG: PGF-CTERM sorting domain-containing protein [Archaeoglobaceae archaeon]